MSVVVLYRKILKAAAKFPSVKKESVIRDIKMEFRENKVRWQFQCLKRDTNSPVFSLILLLNA